MNNVQFRKPFVDALNKGLQPLIFQKTDCSTVRELQILKPSCSAIFSLISGLLTINCRLTCHLKQRQQSGRLLQSNTDSVRRYVNGNYQRDVIPNMIHDGILTISHLGWRSYFTQITVPVTVVKHNQLSLG
jgi:hypothetical protein